jgi:lysozyme
MEYSKNGAKLTEQFEECKLIAYPDPATGGAPWTIGYGHTGLEVHPGLVITQDQAEELLMQDVQKAAVTVNAKVTTDITQEEFDALVDFVFNVGAGNFNASTLLKKVNAGDIQGAANEFLRWDMAAGKHMAGLLKRRHAETEEFLSSMA